MRKLIVLLLALAFCDALCAQGIPYGYTPSSPSMPRHRVSFYCDSPYATVSPYFCYLLTDYLDHHTNWLLAKETRDDLQNGFIVRVRGIEQHEGEPADFKEGDPPTYYSIELLIARHRHRITDKLKDCDRGKLESCFATLQRKIEQQLPPTYKMH